MTQRTCSIEDCTNAHRANGLCSKHYEQERHKRRYAEDREYFRTMSARYRERNKEQLKAAKQRYLREHRVENIERAKRWREAFPDRAVACSRKTYEKYRDRYLAQQKAYRKAHPETQGVIKAWRKANRELVQNYGRAYRARKRRAVIGEITAEGLAGKLAYLGWQCWLCGGVPTAWDHVKPLARGGAHVLANLRPICKPCNSSKNDRWPFPTHRRQ